MTTMGAVSQVALSTSNGVEFAAGIRLTNPYEYANIRDPSSAVELFNILSESEMYEAQAQMWQDFFRNRNMNDYERKRWEAIRDFVQQHCGCQ